MIGAAVQKAADFFAGQERAANPTRYLHVGVGVGDPDATLGGNSSSWTEPGKQKQCASQTNPSYVQDAGKKSTVTMVVMNFQSGKNTVVIEGNTMRMNISAPYPLSITGEQNSKAYQALQTLASQATHVSVLDAVSGQNYAGTILLGTTTRNDTPARKRRFINGYSHNPSDRAYLRWGSGKQVGGYNANLTGSETFEDLFSEPE